MKEVRDLNFYQLINQTVSRDIKLNVNIRQVALRYRLLMKTPQFLAVARNLSGKKQSAAAYTRPFETHYKHFFPREWSLAGDLVFYCSTKDLSKDLNVLFWGLPPDVNRHCSSAYKFTKVLMSLRFCLKSLPSRNSAFSVGLD